MKLCLYLRDTANSKEGVQTHLFVYLGLGFGNVLVNKLVCKIQTQSFSLNWTTLKSVVKIAVKPQNSALQNYGKQIFHNSLVKE